MKKILLFTLFVWVNGLYAFDNVVEYNAFERIIKQDKQSLQKAKNLCMQDKLWIGASDDNEAHFAHACYVVATENLIQNSLKGSDNVELKEDVELMKKACAISLFKLDGCWVFMELANLLKDRLNLPDDYVSENLKKQSFEYLSKACDKEYNIFQSRAKNKNSINGFYQGETCRGLKLVYILLNDDEKASFYEKRADEIKGAK